MTIFDFGSASLRRASAVARPSPIAVIVSSGSTGRPDASWATLGTSTPLSTCSSVSWSAVSGARLDA